MDLMLDEIGYWLALHTVPRCGLSTISTLLKKFSTPKQILLASHKVLLAAGVNPALAKNLRKPDWNTVEFCLRWLEQPQQHILYWDSLYYPPLLREISYPPLILFIKGELSLLQHQALAIVGARNPTATGLEIAHQIASELSELGFVIISGLAKGIDGAAHQGALKNQGLTIAVLGSGLERIYPASNQDLAMDILENGGILLSEFFPLIPPKAENFPRRNRLISGMSLGVIVVEATLRSGSLITASYALEQNREIFAIPGSIRNPLSKGCHALLKEGATLVECTEDIMQGLSFLPGLSKSWVNRAVSASSSYETVDHQAKKRSKVPLYSNKHDNLSLDLSLGNPQSKVIQKKKDLNRLDSQDKKLVECLGFEMTSIDILIIRTGLTIDKLLARLSSLQLQGYIDVVPGDYVRK